VALLSTLKEYQRRYDLTDNEMADKLGVSRSTWKQTRLRQIKVGESVRRGARRLASEIGQDGLSGEILASYDED